MKLEKFSSSNYVESDTKLISEYELEVIRKEAYGAGIRDGADAATEAFSTEKSRCLSRIQEAIGDTYFARNEAHRLALSSLGPLVFTLANTIAPALCENGLASEIAKIAEDIARSAPDEQLVIAVAPEMVKEIGDAFSGPNYNVSIIEDQNLSTEQACVQCSGGFDQIDLAAASSAAISAIEGYFAELSHPIGEATNAG